MPLHRHCITHKSKVVRQIRAHRGQAFKLWSLLGILHWKPGQGFFNVVFGTRTHTFLGACQHVSITKAKT